MQLPAELCALITQTSHSKYNPSERFWGVLANYGGGVLLDSAAAGLGYAQHRTYHGIHPTVHRNHQP